jgi:tripeptide aminopeptidase
MIERFLKYVRFNTQSDANANSTPSTEGQRVFAEYLAEELRAIGMQDVKLDENCYLTASLPTNVSNEEWRMKNEECTAIDNSSFFIPHSSFIKVPTIGLIAHLDTSPDISGENVKPRITKNHNELEYLGQDIIVTDGTTLLGADDKAGIAEIVSALEYLIQHPEIKHCNVRVAFTPDEEIGHGARLLDIERFGADWAYTIDGGEVGELEFENFNAAQAVVKFKGTNIHPGYAKGKMQNSMLCAAKFIADLPKDEIPAETEGYEGFYHLVAMTGTVEKASLTYIIREHNAEKFEQRKDFLKKLAEKYAAEIVITEQYRNMREAIEPVYHIVEHAVAAMKRAGVEPKIKPVRGGTDGAQLSFRGLPCPNIFTGGHNFHGRHEYIPVQSMEKAMKVIVNLLMC